jgi:hypothetical protein
MRPAYSQAAASKSRIGLKASICIIALIGWRKCHPNLIISNPSMWPFMTTWKRTGRTAPILRQRTTLPAMG